MVIETIDASPIMSLTQLTGHVNLDFCKTTTYRISKEHGFENYTVSEKWALTPEQKRLRLEWAIRYQSKLAPPGKL